MSQLEALFSIEGKTALVTGGGVGIGAMIARGYAAAGVRVYIASRKLEQCEKRAAELSEEGRCVALRADLSTGEGCARLAAELAEREPRLDILVNNSGATWGAPLGAFPDSGWDRVLNVNVKGLFLLTQALLPQLEAAGAPDDPARVINLGSIQGVLAPSWDNFSYAASKAAVHQLTRMLAKHLGRRNITVNALLPGPFQSRMMAAIIDRMGDELAAMSPLGRIGRPEDIASAAIYLASPGAAWLTGVLLPVDGGISGTA